jgi:hypothetical protein
MSPPPKSQRRLELLLLGLSATAGLLLILSIVRAELMSTQRPIELVPISLSARQSPNYSVDETDLQIAPARVEMIGEIIHDQDAKADAIARLATVQTNLLTPVPSLLGPTVTRTPSSTPTPTPTVIPTITLTPTPTDPWIPLGQATIVCGSEVVFKPIYAQKIKFFIAAGGGKDNLVSYYCCGSNGITWLINGVWQPLFGREDTLRAGEWRESGNLNGIELSRARFYLGCNDHEPVTIYLNYLPMPTVPNTPTRVR